ncbi:MAG: molybdate ABC transporter substrate-binding protein [Cyanobacteria bacterium J06621_11]
MKRRQFISSFIAGSGLTLFASACSTSGSLLLSGDLPDLPSKSTSAITLTVSAAASLQDVLAAISPQFSTTHPDISIDYNFGASGSLQQQIQQGAPADIFFSAASQPMDELAEKEMILPDSRKSIVANELALIAPLATDIKITDLSQLKHTSIQRFAVGEFRSVPAGQYAEQAFEKFDLLSSLRSKFVFGNNVRTVLSAVESGNADLGMVYTTDAALSARVTVLATAPPNSHSPINYPIAIVKGTSAPNAAQTFIDFLTTEAAQQIFEDFGFGRS